MSARRFNHVAVLKGGFSPEREVSLVTGRECAAGLREAGYRVTEVDVTRDLGALVAALKPADGEAPEVAFNALHGTFGEDGRMQGVLDILGVPYTHSGAAASALAMDKQMAKRVFASSGIRTPEGRIVERRTLAAGDPMPRPFVVKPNDQGSSVGVHIAREGDNEPLFEPSEETLGETVLVERYIPGRELTVAVMGDRALGVTELRPKVKFYDYAAKYTDGVTEHILPAEIPPAVYDEALRVALLAHEVLGCSGLSRADFRYDDRKDERGLYLLEVNTQPGMTPLSLAPEQARWRGIPFPDLVSWLVENARCRA